MRITSQHYPSNVVFPWKVQVRLNDLHQVSRNIPEETFTINGQMSIRFVRKKQKEKEILTRFNRCYQDSFNLRFSTFLQISFSFLSLDCNDCTVFTRPRNDNEVSQSNVESSNATKESFLLIFSMTDLTQIQAGGERRSK